MCLVNFPLVNSKVSSFPQNVNNIKIFTLVLSILAILFTLISFIFLGITFSSTIFYLSAMFLSVSLLALVFSLASCSLLIMCWNFNTLQLTSLKGFEKIFLPMKKELLFLREMLEKKTNDEFKAKENLLIAQERFDEESSLETNSSVNFYFDNLEKEKEKKYLQSQLKCLDQDVIEIKEEIKFFEEKNLFLKESLLKENQEYLDREKKKKMEEEKVLLENKAVKSSLQNLSSDLTELKKELANVDFQVNCMRKRYRLLAEEELELNAIKCRFYRDAQTTTVEETLPLLKERESFDDNFSSSIPLDECEVELYEDYGICSKKEVCLSCFSLQKKRLLLARKEEIPQIIEKCSKCEKEKYFL